jgi:hypothetical protein
MGDNGVASASEYEWELVEVDSGDEEREVVVIGVERASLMARETAGGEMEEGSTARSLPLYDMVRVGCFLWIGCRATGRRIRGMDHGMRTAVNERE